MAQYAALVYFQTLIFNYLGHSLFLFESKLSYSYSVFSKAHHPIGIGILSQYSYLSWILILQFILLDKKDVREIVPRPSVAEPAHVQRIRIQDVNPI